jgi:hypothetical protein
MTPAFPFGARLNGLGLGKNGQLCRYNGTVTYMIIIEPSGVLLLAGE